MKWLPGTLFGSSAVVGHSVGEVASCWASGMLSLDEAILVSRERSRIQAQAAGRGSMLAVGLTLAWLLDLDAATFHEHARKTAIKRTGHRGLLRNAIVAAGNSGEHALRPQLERHAAGEDPLLAEHARWALDRLGAVD